MAEVMDDPALMTAWPLEGGRHSSTWVPAAYVLVLALSFSPLKSLAYGLPLMVVALGTALETARWRFVRRPMALVTLVLVVSVGHSVLYPDFLWMNVFVGLLTYSSLLLLLADFGRPASFALIVRLSRITVGFLLFQAAVGVTQSLYSAIVLEGGSFDLAAGDAVKGTINPLPVGDGTGSNQMFAVLLAMFLIAIVPSRRLVLPRWQRLGLPLIALAWVLASVMHTVLFVLVAVGAGVLLAPVGGGVRTVTRAVRRVKLMAVGVVGAVVLGGTVLVFLPSNVATLPYFATQAVEELRSPGTGGALKVLATVNTVAVLPTVHGGQPIYGLGLGQYSSRAGLIMSGTYLSREFYVEPRARDVSYDLIYSLQEAIRGQNVGSTNFPYYSWLSLYGEFGLIGVFSLLCWVGLILRRTRRRPRREVLGAVEMRQSLVMAVVFLLLLGLQDNYWEFSQAIVAPLFLLKLQYDYLRKESRTSPHASGWQEREVAIA